MRAEWRGSKRKVFAIFGVMTRAKVLSLFPLATITAYWLGNQAVLFAVSVILPIILAIQAFIRPNESTENNRLGDALTDLPQPKILVDLLSHTLENKHKTGLNTACIVVDIDGFTKLNTSLGQARGNDVLKRISDRIVAAVREEDVVVRLENDCFAIALDPVYKVDLESTLSVVRRIQKSVHDPMNLAGSSIAISISSGYCLGSGSPENTGESLVQAAKNAMKEARRNGAGGIRGYSSDLSIRHKTRSILNDEVTEALKRGQIIPWFQPQISTLTGEVVGFEALARWLHPRRGILQAADFIPAIQSAGLFVQLGEMMLTQSLSAMQKWQDAGHSVDRVGINLSDQELCNPRLLEQINWELDRFGMSPDRLNFEVLETVLADPKDINISNNLRELAASGCNIDLDCFGTGHSSITSLRQFPIKRIKIDKSFVKNIHIERGQKNMMRAIMNLADQLDIQALADGAEDIEELKLLSEMGCEFVQGFCIARAMPADDALTWLTSYNEKLLRGKSVEKLAI